MRLRVAIVGAGLMGHWHAHSAKQCGALITAIIDQNEATATALADRFGGEVFSCLADALAAVNFDCVHICTPLASHASLVQEALSSNRHVIVEKPISSSVSELQPLIELAASKQLLLCPVHQFPFQNGIARLQEEMAGREGSPLRVSFDFASAGGVGRSADELNQLLLEILPHPLSILTQLWPLEVAENEEWSVSSPRAGELYAYSNDGAFPVDITLSLHARPTHCYMKVYHECGAIHLDLFHGYAVFDSPRVSRFSKISLPFTHSVKTFWAATVNLITRALRREPAYPGLGVLIEKCYAAIEQSKPGPIDSENYLAITRLCEVFKAKLPE